jgi:hypothetical protein
MASRNPSQKEPLAAPAPGVVIAHPANAGDHMNVEAPFAPPQDPPSDGLLCVADGTATPSAPNQAIKIVGVLVDYPTVNHNEADIPSDSRTRWFYVPTPRNGAANIRWAFSNADDIWCPTQPSGVNNAKIWAVAYEGEEGGLPEEIVPVAVASRAFEGVGVQSCVRSIDAEKHEVRGATECIQERCHFRSVLGAIPHVHEGSCGLIGDWLHYRRLSPAAINGGHRLLDEEGQPLSASLVAVACKDVRWHPSPSSALTVRVPHGHAVADLRPGPASGPIAPLFKWKFPELPPYCVVVYQPPTPDPLHPHGPAYELAYMVSADCTEHPNILSLNPDKPVFVTVNDRLIDYTDNTGYFSLLLSVIED